MILFQFFLISLVSFAEPPGPAAPAPEKSCAVLDDGADAKSAGMNPDEAGKICRSGAGDDLFKVIQFEINKLYCMSAGDVKCIQHLMDLEERALSANLDNKTDISEYVTRLDMRSYMKIPNPIMRRWLKNPLASRYIVNTNTTKLGGMDYRLINEKDAQNIKARLLNERGCNEKDLKADAALCVYYQKILLGLAARNQAQLIEASKNIQSKTVRCQGRKAKLTYKSTAGVDIQIVTEDSGFGSTEPKPSFLHYSISSNAKSTYMPYDIYFDDQVNQDGLFSPNVTAHLKKGTDPAPVLRFLDMLKTPDSLAKNGGYSGTDIQRANLVSGVAANCCTRTDWQGCLSKNLNFGKRESVVAPKELQ